MAAENLLVIGYGNTLRRDDGVGAKVAGAFAARECRGVRSMTCHQLTPELAEVISREEAVVFVDATIDRAEGVELRELGNATEGALFGHQFGPAALVAMAGKLFGHRPRAWLLAVPVEDLGMGEGLSERAQKGADVAVGMIESLVAG